MPRIVPARELQAGQTIEYETNGRVVLGTVEHDDDGTVMLDFAEVFVDGDGHRIGGWHVDPDTPVEVVDHP